jgi:hypothetical protein
LPQEDIIIIKAKKEMSLVIFDIVREGENVCFGGFGITSKLDIGKILQNKVDSFKYLKSF